MYDRLGIFGWSGTEVCKWLPDPPESNHPFTIALAAGKNQTKEKRSNAPPNLLIGQYVTFVHASSMHNCTCNLKFNRLRIAIVMTTTTLSHVIGMEVSIICNNIILIKESIFKHN